MTTVNLARLAEVNLQVTLINHGYPQGRGVAYSTRRPEHLLNVAARNMSALPDHPNHFVEWLRTRTEFSETPEAELRETFMPRRVYGDYLRSLSLQYTQPLDYRGCVETHFVDEEATDIIPEGTGARIVLASGREIQADKVVLATGNETPANLPGTEKLHEHPGYAANPWQNWESRLPAATESIVLLGTGLTAVDAIISLLALDWRGTIYAVSRNGLLPQSHFKGAIHPEFPPEGIDIATLGLERLVELIEQHCMRLSALGENPAIVVDKLRPHTQRIWQGFSTSERKTFVQRYAARWNVMRHRIAQPIHRQVTTAINEGRLKISRGSITRLEPHGSHIRVRLDSPAALETNGTHPSMFEAALVINCTGPQTRFSATHSRLLRNLLSRGVVQPDAMDMGVHIDGEFVAMDTDGKASPFLLVIGPLLRGTFWETIAVPELRGQCLHVAQALLKGAPLRPAPVRASEPEPAVVEYWI